ncbi:protein transport protein SEC61 gamma subunit [Cavenderia fasciculata]|uniref:Protein transport protein SEC61 gamma subunit n=1 Tax=Cavenderia fasciculata TaxID=261658 RepID=F4Q9S2_CACFS|nr:protein transport protein SEC61 gamma subunit [Cavenderia fasciculata]EGG15441.1 protein transport protein SEC61 gamma subunit [Cavenderia fasciculata]|eukprot:XP_004354183.1 protein transport protein SEC61 gamma subunit [Cavenderia fasciculata]
MDLVEETAAPLKEFFKNSMRLFRKCTKPDQNGKRLDRQRSHDSDDDHIFYKKFQKIALATLIGFAIMGFIGFFVKLIHIPINNILVGGV